MIFDKIKYLVKIGGTKLLLLKAKDRLCNTQFADDYIYHYYKSADPEDYPELLRDWYKNMTGQELNLNDPKNFNEKIQWLKLYDSTPQKTLLTDKYLVRDWIKEKIGEEYLVPLLGVWDRFDDIDFNTLPNQFVLKCNHGSGWNLVVKDKSLLDISAAKMKFDKWINENYAFHEGFELQYKEIPPKIIAEKYIEQMDGDLWDYKIHVFNGVPKLIRVIGGRDFGKHTAKELSFDLNWNPIELMYTTFDAFKELPPKPDNLERLLDISRKLGEGFRFVRVDLYDIEGKIMFGEMTFTPASGAGYWGERDQYTAGSWINISQ